MITTLAPRILALPAGVRRKLARADGPGWLMSPERDGDRMWTADRGWHMERLPAVCSVFASFKAPEVSVVIDCCTRYGWGWAFWPANPAASVAAVTGWPLWSVYERFADVLDNKARSGDNHAAALSIIEAYVANGSPHA